MSIEVDDNRKPLSVYLLIFIAISIINTILARFGVLAYPVGPGASGLYFSVAFMIAFTLWFGGWGVIAAYIGCYIGAGMLAGMPHSVNLYWSLADVWQVLIPLIAFKELKADVSLTTRRGIAVFLVFGWMLNNVIGAAWGATTLAVSGLASWSEAPHILVGWLTGNLIVTILITPLLLRYVTRHIQKAGLYITKYWS